jgi:hypothetical protein
MASASSDMEDYESVVEKNPKKYSDELDDAEYSKIHECLNFSTMDVKMKPLLPAPFHNLTFSQRTGWRYHPRALWMDRLGSARELEGMPADDYDDFSAKLRDAAIEEPQEYSDRKRKLSPSNVEEEFGTLLSSLDISHKKMAGSSNATVATVATMGTASMDGRSGGAPKETTQDVSSTTNNGFNATPPPPSASLRKSANDALAATNTSNPNPLEGKKSDKNVPDSVAPKAALYTYFGKKPRKIQLNNAKQYITWDNGKPTHEQLFTALFLDPLTNEVFLAGPWQPQGNGNSDAKETSKLYQEIDGIYWYPRKAMAEHAAAARCRDCLLMRDGLNTPNESQMGEFPPYWPSQQPFIPWDQIPKRVLQQLPPGTVPAEVLAAAGHASTDVPHATDNNIKHDEQSVVTARTDAAVAGTRQGNRRRPLTHPQQQQRSWGPQSQPRFVHAREIDQYCQQQQQVSFPVQPLQQMHSINQVIDNPFPRHGQMQHHPYAQSQQHLYGPNPTMPLPPPPPGNYRYQQQPPFNSTAVNGQFLPPPPPPRSNNGSRSDIRAPFPR